MFVQWNNHLWLHVAASTEVPQRLNVSSRLLNLAQWTLRALPISKCYEKSYLVLYLWASIVLAISDADNIEPGIYEMWKRHTRRRWIEHEIAFFATANLSPDFHGISRRQTISATFFSLLASNSTLWRAKVSNNMEMPWANQFGKRSAKNHECYYWRKGHCKYQESKCLYTHHSTGIVADKPIYDKNTGEQLESMLSWAEQSLMGS
jgi:hypothetical protein